ncbi:MAG TPA: hypothetical protein P5081_06510 [Phycisphaerae bacterium]|nr:hypothetical protein [Phycisphaerae bacterium]HRW52522.1 hypothetical protein [Phycisphaerae bacterium]
MKHRPRSIATLAAATLIVAALPMTGCAPADFDGGVAWSVHKNRTTNARTRLIEGMPFLRVDDYLLDRLTGYDGQGADAGVRFGDLLDQSHILATTAAAEEIDHLPDAAIDALWQKHFPNDTANTQRRAEIKARYLRRLDDDYAAYRKQVDITSDAASRQQFAAAVVEHAADSVKDQRGHGPLLQAIASQYTRHTTDNDVPTKNLDVYAPPTALSDEFTEAGMSTDEAAALLRYAPTLRQQHVPGGSYDERIDNIGRVQLDGTPGAIVVNVDTAAPTVYAYTHKAVIHDREHLQLVYCWWFPEHPAMSQGDPEAGKVDGATIRITLDSRNQPAIVETIQNCGCHIRCFASAALNSEALRGDGDADPARVALEKPPGAKPRLDITSLFDAPANASVPRLNVISRAGYHDVVAIEPENEATTNGNGAATRHYTLEPYDTLENLPTRFGRASMFGPDGLVHNAGRLEGWLLAPTGMRSAGQPRQRGTQLVCWDALNFDDPHLLEKTLRLPNDF